MMGVCKMGNVRIHKSNVAEAKKAAKDLEKSIDTTYNTCETLTSYALSASWEGKTRDSFITYMEILKQYHHEMLTTIQKQTKALNNLETYTNDFRQDNSVKAVRNL